MTLPHVTYSDYEGYGGTLDEAAFNTSIKSACAKVREIIGFNEPQDDEDIQAYTRAVCAAVDVDAAYGASGGIGENVASITLGRFSASTGGATGGRSAYDIDMSRAIRGELVGSTLLYQGLR